MSNPKTTAEEIEDLRAATRAAHEAIADARQARRELEQFATTIRRGISAAVESEFAARIRSLADEHQRHLDASIVKASDKVFQRFKDLEAELLGESPDQRARLGGMSIPEIAKTYRQIRGASPKRPDED